METKDIILTISALFGPIISTFIAIYYTRYADEKKIRDDRRFEVFRNLMKTRGFQLHQDHVMSLNLIPADFNNDADLIAKYKEYINHLYRPVPTDPGEGQRFFSEREILFGQLLVSIAKVLNINLEADEARHFRYAPIGWANTEFEQQQLRTLLIEVLRGNSAISVRPAPEQPRPAQTPPNLFPQPPTIDNPPR